MRRFPEVSFDIFASSSREARSRLDASDADFAVTYDDLGGPGAEEIHAGAVVPVVRAKHPLLKFPQSERWHSLSPYPLAIPRSLRAGQIDDQAISQQIERHAARRFLFDSYETAIRFLQTSDAWSFFPEWLTNTQLGKLAVLVKDEIRTPYVVHFRAGARADRVISKALHEELQQQCGARTSP